MFPPVGVRGGSLEEGLAAEAVPAHQNIQSSCLEATKNAYIRVY